MTDGACDIQWARFYDWGCFGIKLYISSFVVKRFLWIFCLYHMKTPLLGGCHPENCGSIEICLFVWASWPVQHSNTGSTSVWIWDGAFCLADQWKTRECPGNLCESHYLIYLCMHVVTLLAHFSFKSTELNEIKMLTCSLNTNQKLHNAEPILLTVNCSKVLIETPQFLTLSRNIQLAVKMTFWTLFGQTHLVCNERVGRKFL